MTSRIQADGEGKEAKWADIDDDEDDWAPETIEWNDGTKISLGQADLPTPAKEAMPAPSAMDSTKAAPAKKVLATQLISSVGPNATILKVGQNAEKQAKAAALQPNGPTDKPMLSTSKAPAPVPAKSPWAPLPPVSKSPITINPDTSAAQQRSYFPTSGQPQSQTPVAQSPAQEISADDFNRNWRDAHSMGPRELFMPNSGRYEAVNERRRMSRNDQHFRQPSVLQRPSGHDSRSPAEPSAAFQTNRVSADQERGQWGRRRASSNVSGGSGQIGRRMSFGKVNDAGVAVGDQPPRHQRRDSRGHYVTSHIFQPQVPPGGVSPSQHSVETRQLSHDSPRLSHVSSDIPSSPAHQSVDMATSIPPQEDPVIVQKRVMAEKRELARRRRQEEEEREEAAKRERIRLKLEALGPAPPSKTHKMEAIPALSGAPPASGDSEIKATDESATSPQSPPKPPVPEATGEPKQYGMMKVHHPETVKRMIPQPSTSQSVPSQQRPNEQQPLHEARSDPLRPSHPVVNGIHQSSDDMLRQVGKVPENKPNEKGPRGWVETSGNSTTVSPWAPPRVDQQPKTSLWGSSINNALGNGTFDRSLAEFTGTRGQLPPPNQAGRTTLWAHETSAFPTIEPGMKPPSAPPMGASELSQTIPSFPSAEERPMAANSEVDSVQPTSRPMPIGPPQAQPSPVVPTAKLPQVGVAAWNNFHNAAAREDRAANERYRRDLAARLEEEARTGVHPTSQVTYNETWQQVDAGDQAGRRNIVGVARSTNANTQPVNPFGSVGSAPPDLMAKSSPLMNGGQKASRFFPPGNTNSFMPHDRRSLTYSHPELTGMASSPSPPPPEELGHPAFAGNALRPNVSLPKPKAVVRLPPKEFAQPPAPKPSSSPQTWSAVVGQRAVSTPLSSSDSKQQAPSQSWQSRFNTLLHKKDGMSEKKQALAIAPSTKDALDVLREAAMTVSLPGFDQDVPIGPSRVTTKDVEDEDEIFEDRVAGSLPVVKVPLEVSSLALEPLPLNRNRTRYVKQVEPSSVRYFAVGNDVADRGSIVIQLPGSQTQKKVMPLQRVDQGGGVLKPTRNNHSHNKNRRAPKSRESSGTFKQTHQPNHKPGGGQQSPRPNAQPMRPGFSHQHANGWRGPRQTASVSH